MKNERTSSAMVRGRGNHPRSVALAGALLGVMAALPQAQAAGGDACSSYGGEPGLGPLMIRSQSPGQVLRFAAVPHSPVVLETGQVEFHASGNVTSTWAADGSRSYFLDMQMADSRVAVVTGLGGCWGLEIAWDERSIVDAGLDDVTIAFHHLFGLSSSGQEQAVRNDTRVEFPAYGVTLGKRDRGSFSRSLEVSLTHLVQPLTPTRPAVSAAISTRFETERADADADRKGDVGLALYLEQVVGGDRLYANIAHTWFGTTTFRGIPLKPQQTTAALAYERRYPRGSLIAQYLFSEGVILGAGDLGAPAHEVHLGGKWRAGKAVLEAALIENIITYDNSPDFGFSLGAVLPL